MIEKFPFMLRFSKHSESFFNSLLLPELVFSLIGL